jgi:hypothetical protein
MAKIIYRPDSGEIMGMWIMGRGLHSSPIQLNLSSFVHRVPNPS